MRVLARTFFVFGPLTSTVRWGGAALALPGSATRAPTAQQSSVDGCPAAALHRRGIVAKPW